MTSLCHKRRRGHTKPLHGGVFAKIKEREDKQKVFNEESFFSRELEKGLEVSFENSKAANKRTYAGVHLQEGRKAGRQRFREVKCTKTPAIVKDLRALQLEGPLS